MSPKQATVLGGASGLTPPPRCQPKTLVNGEGEKKCRIRNCADHWMHLWHPPVAQASGFTPPIPTEIVLLMLTCQTFLPIRIRTQLFVLTPRWFKTWIKGEIHAASLHFFSLKRKHLQLPPTSHYQRLKHYEKTLVISHYVCPPCDRWALKYCTLWSDFSQTHTHMHTQHAIHLECHT